MRFLVDEEVRVSIEADRNWVKVKIGNPEAEDAILNLEPEEARAFAMALQQAAAKAEHPL